MIKCKQSAFTIVELLIVMVIIGILATLTVVAYTGIQQRAIVASIYSDLTGASRSLKLFQVENSDDYPMTNDCSSTPAANSICLKSSPGNTYTVFETSNSGFRSFCITIKNNTNNTKYHITQDSGPEIGVCPFGFATTLEATTASPTSIDLSWSAVTDATSYTLEQATNESFTDDLTTIATQPGLSFTSISLSQGTTYYYRVNATVDGDISNWSNTADATTSIDPPSAPTVTANTVADTTTWSWNTPACIAGTAQYQYRYTIVPDGFDSGWTATASSPVAFTTNAEGQTYLVQVQAQCFLGTITSSWSALGQASYYRLNLYGFTKRRTITLANSGKGVVTNLPLLVKIDDSSGGYPGLTAYNKIGFRDASGNQLNWDNITFIDGGISYYFVKIPSVENSNSAHIYVYYGNDSTTTENVTGVWSSDFIAAYTFQSSTNDQSANARNLTNGGTTDVAGLIGRARNFDGSNDRLTGPDYDFSGDFSVLMLVQPHMVSNSLEANIFQKMEWSMNTHFWTNRIASYNGWNAYVDWGTTTTDWRMVTYRNDADTASYTKEHLSGVAGSGGGLSGVGGGAWTWGVSYDLGWRYWDGIINMWFFTNDCKTSGWADAFGASIINHLSYVTYSAEEF